MRVNEGPSCLRSLTVDEVYEVRGVLGGISVLFHKILNNTLDQWFGSADSHRSLAAQSDVALPLPQISHFKHC